MYVTARRQCEVTNCSRQTEYDTQISIHTHTQTIGSRTRAAAADNYPRYIPTYMEALSGSDDSVIARKDTTPPPTPSDGDPGGSKRPISASTELRAPTLANIQNAAPTMLD